MFVHIIYYCVSVLSVCQIAFIQQLPFFLDINNFTRYREYDKYP